MLTHIFSKGWPNHHLASRCWKYERPSEGGMAVNFCHWCSQAALQAAFAREIYVFPEQQNAMGSLHNIVSVCSGRAGAVPGIKRVPGTVPGTGSDGFRGLDRFQRSEVPGFRGSGNRFQWFRDLGTGFREPKVLRRFRIPEIRFPRFRKLLCTSKVYFCTRGAALLYYESMLLHLGCYTFVLRKYTFVLRKYTVALWKYTLCASKVYFWTLKIYFCTWKVYFLYFESILLYFESILCVRKYTFEFWKYTFELWKYTVDTVVLWNILLYFERILLYFESVLL